MVSLEGRVGVALPKNGQKSKTGQTQQSTNPIELVISLSLQVEVA